MKTIVKIALTLVVSCLSVSSFGQTTNYSFVLIGETGKEIKVINPERAKLPLPPFSTFKIPNTLISLDLNLVEPGDSTYSFDREKYPQADWWPKSWHQKPLTIRQAFQNSALPIYQQLAVKTGSKNMSKYVNQFEYGNQDISSGLDTFWLNGSLKISALEQTQFLKRLNDKKLPLAAETYSAMKEIMLTKNSEGSKLYAKTGGGYLDKDKALGWYVGIIEKEGKSYYFALNMEGKTFSEVRNKRIDLAISHLTKQGIL